jgi:hypothetical protein
LNTPAPLSNDEWHWRWQYADADDYDFLHRIAAPFSAKDKEGWEFEAGTAVCGLKGTFQMPGVMSRMGRPRCPKCCEIMSVPEGDGAPYNQKGAEWKER